MDVNAEMRRQMAQHRAACPRCSAYTADIVRNREAVGRLSDAELPDGFHERLMARIGAEARPVQRKGRVPYRIFASLAAALLLFIIVRGMYMEFGSQRLAASPEPGVHITALDPQAEAALDKGTDERYAAPMEAEEEAFPRIFHPLTITVLGAAGGIIVLGFVLKKRA
jgi:anti-sigma factor RsiW